MPKQERTGQAAAKQTLKNAIKKALLAFKPPEKLTVSGWADTYRVMSSEETSSPGKWDTNKVPYMRFIMDCFCDDSIEEISWLKCTQIGGTEGLLNFVGYTIDQDPGRIVYVLPDDTLCKDFSDLRLQKMLDNCPTLSEKFYANDSKDSLLKFKGGFLIFASAQSPSALASWSARILLLDEIDKYPRWTGREANPIDLAEERAKNWWNRKIAKVSTPTLKTGAIYRSYQKADIRYQYKVPCPHCGHEQVFSLQQIKWPKNADGSADPTVVYYAAYYECESCRGRIDDRHKPAMLRAGKWAPDKVLVGRARSVGFHINSIYSPWLTFGQVAAKFLASKDEPESLMNFVNSWLGEPWEDKAATLDSDLVLSKQTEIPEGVVPEWAQLLTAGVDVQKNRMYWTIRAWGYKLTSQKITSGVVKTWADLEMIMDKFWPDVNGELRWQVNLCAIDSGYDTETVYDVCLMNQEWAVPVKGSSNPMLQRYRQSAIDSPGKKFHGQTLYIVDGDQYKSMIAGRLNKPLGEGCWMVHAGCDNDYAAQVTAEHKIRERKNNKDVETWVKKTSAADNHYLDAEVYAAMAADLLHVRYLDDIPVDQGAQVVQKTETDHKDDWIDEKIGGDWLK